LLKIDILSDFVEIPAAAVDLEPLGDILALFLTEFIGKRCPNEA
jgi:hypothetical protein